MSGTLNKVILIGRLGQDPQSIATNAGNTIVKFSLATSERWKDRSTGEPRERTEWHRIVIYNEHIAKIAGQYLKKGSHIHLEGQIQTRKWQDQSGQDRYTSEIVLANFKGELTMLSGYGDQAGGDDGYGGGGGGQAPARTQGRSDSQNNGGNMSDAQRTRQTKQSMSAQSPNIDDDIPF